MISYRQADLSNTLKQLNLPNVVWFFNDDRKSTKKYDADRKCIVLFNGEQPIPLKSNDAVIFRPGNLVIVIDGDELASAANKSVYINSKLAGEFLNVGITGDAVYQSNKPNVLGDKGRFSPLDYIIHFDGQSVMAVEYPITIPRDAMARRADLKDKILPKPHKQLTTVKISELFKGFDEGHMVRYVPQHANGDLNHRDCEIGTISSWNSKWVFVNFGKGDTSPACDPNDLVWMWNYGVKL